MPAAIAIGVKNMTSAAPQVANASMYLVSSQVSIPPQG